MKHPCLWRSAHSKPTSGWWPIFPRGVPLPGLALPRAARLPVLAALRTDLNCPILLLTDRADRALTLLDELAFWAPEAPSADLP